MLGDRIRTLRQARSWTQAHLADAAGLSLRTVQRLENADGAAPETLMAIAAAFGIDVREINGAGEIGAPTRSEGWLWPAPHPGAASLWGALLVLPAALFVTVNLLRSGAGIAGPYDAFAAAGGALGLEGAFGALSPFVFVGGPLAALVLNLLAQIRPQGTRGRGAVTLTGVQLRLSRAALAVTLTAAAALAALLAYQLAESLGGIVR